MSYRTRVKAAGLATIHNKELTVADTEYSVVLPAGTIYFELHARGDHDIRVAFVTGKVATPVEPYWTVYGFTEWYTKQLLLLANKTIYLASSDALTVVEIIAWSTA